MYEHTSPTKPGALPDENLSRPDLCNRLWSGTRWTQTRVNLRRTALHSISHPLKNETPVASWPSGIASGQQLFLTGCSRYFVATRLPCVPCLLFCLVGGAPIDCTNMQTKWTYLGRCVALLFLAILSRLDTSLLASSSFPVPGMVECFFYILGEFFIRFLFFLVFLSLPGPIACFFRGQNLGPRKPSWWSLFLHASFISVCHFQMTFMARLLFCPCTNVKFTSKSLTANPWTK